MLGFANLCLLWLWLWTLANFVNLSGQCSVKFNFNLPGNSSRCWHDRRCYDIHCLAVWFRVHMLCVTYRGVAANGNWRWWWWTLAVVSALCWWWRFGLLCGRLEVSVYVVPSVINERAGSDHYSFIEVKELSHCMTTTDLERLSLWCGFCEWLLEL